MTESRAGGIAALFEAAAFTFGFIIFFAVLGPAKYGAAGVDPTNHIAFLAAHQPLMTLFNFVIYIAFGAALWSSRLRFISACAAERRPRPAPLWRSR